PQREQITSPHDAIRNEQARLARPHAEERTKCASRSMRRPSCFETLAALAPQDEGGARLLPVCHDQARRSSPFTCLRSLIPVVRLLGGAQPARPCMVPRLSQSTRSPTRQACSQANSGRATKSHSSSSNASDSASSSPTRYALRRRPR